MIAQSFVGSSCSAFSDVLFDVFPQASDKVRWRVVKIPDDALLEDRLLLGSGQALEFSGGPDLPRRPSPKLADGMTNGACARDRTGGSIEGAEVMRIVRELNVPGQEPLRPTWRPKTLNTTIEKLKRERSRLATVQDLVGARIMITGGLAHQDRVVDALVGTFADTEVIDRRENPSQGYRAVHVVITHDRYPIEMQIRTAPQDQWAQLFEKLGDLWGRQICYGDPPNNPDGPVDPVHPDTPTPDEVLTRGDLVRDCPGFQRLLKSLDRIVDVSNLSEETLRRTHSRYFESPAELASA